ncbi:MAG: AAA family ATPase [Acaryochloris sp. RU_4_1]|nr:AAA family ATPase [Acaryochloris sp. RU_4_1]NJN37599.1 AAA family ATPase [Acaryochloridaceae cyanobacterium CSU_3_4]NJR55321.1 AAA family ATPase [Acaryochloris sp. CRU_2_0]
MASERDQQFLSWVQPGEQSADEPLGNLAKPALLGSQSLNIRFLGRLVRRNILLIVGINLCVTGLTAYFVLSRPRTYEGEFQLLVEPVTAIDKVTDLSIPSYQNEGLDDPLDNSRLIKTLKSPRLLTAILQQIQPTYPLSYNELLKGMKVDPISRDEAEQTQLIQVSYTSKDQSKILFILEKLVEGYLKYSLEDRKSQIQDDISLIEAQLPELRQRIYTLEGQLQPLAIDKPLGQFPSVEGTYEQLNRQLTGERRTLTELLLAREALKMEATQGQVPWQISTQPQLKTDEQGHLISSGHSQAQTLALGVIGGLLLGLGAALLKEKQQDTFLSIEDLQADIPLPLLGTLPFNRAIEMVDQIPSPRELGEKSAAHHQNQAFLQASEALYTKIRFLDVNRTVRALVVSSIAAREGKTTVGLYLAQAIARMGQRVLLVDANMVFPQLHSRLGLPNVEGLRDVLGRNLDPNQLIQRVPYQKNLSILTAGQGVSGANKALASTPIEDLMEQLHSAFDVVLYDTPHLQGYTDARFLTVNANGLLMVVGMGKTRRSAFVKVLKDLQASRLPILGLVANFSDEEPSDPLQENYGDDYFGVEDLEDEFEIFRERPSQP